jgi:MerR family mercuric resistance operon transcriptional regulator
MFRTSRHLGAPGLDPVARYGHYPAVMEALTISQLAHDAGVNVETVRYYERRGLLREPPRTRAGYRQYSADDLWRLQFIGRAKRLGFTLAEIASLGTGNSTSAEDVLKIARSKVQMLEERQRELSDTRSHLLQLVTLCEDPNSDDCVGLRVPT